MKRHHIIIINPDEMRWDSMGHTGSPAAHTPFIDEFVSSEAVSFDRAYCQNPVCVPSRCSFLTGLYPHVHGHRTMRFLQHEWESNLFRELKDAGYYVWMNARNDLVAGQITDLAESQADEIYYYDKRKPVPRVDVLQMAAGFREKSAGKQEEEGKNPFPYSHFTGLSQGKWDGDWEDTYAAVDRILHPVDPEKPLCLFLGWTNPHPPYQVEEPYFSMIDREKIADPVPFEECNNKSLMIQRLHDLVDMEAYTKDQWREMRAVYLAQCAKVDDMFRVVCDALKEAGIYDDSAIFFLSDHGDFCGDYQLPEKAQNSFEDCLTRVPLLIKPPKDCPVDPGRTGALAELVDFYATAMDYAGVDPGRDHFGRSLRPIVEDRQEQVREYVCCEGGRNAGEIQCDEWHCDGENGPAPGGAYWPKKTAQKDDLTHEKGTMICDGRYKYVQRHSGRNECYDLMKDPQEKNNLYGSMDVAEQVLWFQQKLLDWYQVTCDVVPREYDSRFTEERIWTTLRNFCPPEMEQEVREYLRKEAPDYMDAIRHVMGVLLNNR